jgi:phage gp46-like protein
MTDIALAFDADRSGFDLVLAGDGAAYDLQGDDGLLTAVVVSLFTDARAGADDPLPDERAGVPSDRRGWWGDPVPDEDGRDSMGSLLWLLWREKETPEVVARAERYAQEALRWLTRDGHVAELHVAAYRVGPSYLGLDVRALPAPGTDDRTREWRFVVDYANAAPVSIRSPGT